AAANPTRWPPTPQRRAARRTGGSRSCCIGRSDALNALFAFLIARLSLSVMGTGLLAALLWFFGPFLSFLEGWEIRVALIAVMFLVGSGVNLFLDWRRRRRDLALTEGIAAAPADPSALAS